MNSQDEQLSLPLEIAPVQESKMVPAESASPNLFQSFWGGVVGAASAVGGVASQAGGAVVGAVTGTTEVVLQTGSSMAGSVTGTAGMVSDAAVQATSVVATAAMQIPDGLSQMLSFIGDNPQLRELTKKLDVDDLLFRFIDQVNVRQAAEQVRQLQIKYPHESSRVIANRIIVGKSVYAGGSGLASSVLPGVAAGLFALDLAATTALQAEMIYQIAAAYNLDLDHPARRGEVLAIFGLGLGGNAALKAGLGFVRNIPAAGAVIGASSNAAMIYVLGHTACQFYEAKVNPLESQSALQASQAENEDFVLAVTQQEILMDQILAYVVMANNPDKTWGQILLELQKMHFSPASIEVIAGLASPPRLEDLLANVDQNFAVSILAQCQKIAEFDGIITDEEALVIERIKTALLSRTLLDGS
ncbi:hypothetical protein ACN4EG_21700 [Alkalinema pantanalense CENA528]|uniref:hypothetical protein n=1 Tax=Alkalinema pantanalense TaxID=1620705 RepID=UPI003D6EE9B8